MNDQDLDRLVASAAPVRDDWLSGLDLVDAEMELMEEIMTTANPPATTPSGAPTPEALPAGEPPASDRTPSDPRDVRDLHDSRGPRRSRTSRRTRLAVAAGFVAVAMVGVVALRSMAGDGDGATDVNVGSESTVTPMIADPTPEGYAVLLVSPEDGPDPWPAAEPGPNNTWVYGDLTGTALTNDIVLRVAPAAPEGDVLGEPVTVRGQDGLLCSPGPQQCDFGNNTTGVSWTDPSGVYVTVESNTFDRDQVLAIAEGLVLDGTTAELGDVPAGMTKPPKVAELDSEWSWAYSVDYSTPDAQSSFTVSTRPESEAMRVYDLWLSGPREDITVQGHSAAFEDIDGSYVLTWEAAPGQLVEVLANGVDEATARAFAETVRPATDAEWADIQEQARNFPTEDVPGGFDPPPQGAVHRQLADGTTEVWGWRNDDGGLCYQIASDGVIDDNLCTGDSATAVLGVSPTNNDGELIWDRPAAVGVAPEGTASIDGGEVTLREAVDGGQLFVWEFADGEMPDTLTFRDAAGAELATTEVVVF